MAHIIIRTQNGEEHTINLLKDDFLWEVVETDEREMGIERLHEATLDEDIDGEPVTFIFHVLEYPEGSLNNEEIEVEGADLVQGCSLFDFIDLY